jgi:hypothetical protein
MSSHTPAPAVTGACRGTREHCGYGNGFAVGEQYIWTNFEHDVTQLESSLMHDVVDKDSHKREEARHLEVQSSEDKGFLASFSS